MSGIASAASTIPGSVATFWSCSSERSCAIAASSSSSAKTRAGTRMSPRASGGIPQSVSSMRVMSDIEHDLRPPDTAVAGKFEAMVRHCFHEVRRTATVAGGDCPKTRAVKLQPFQPLRDEILALREEDELIEPRGEERCVVLRLGSDLVLYALTSVVPRDEFGEGCERLGEDGLARLGRDVELHLGRVLDPLVHLRRRENVRAAAEHEGCVQVPLVHALERWMLEVDLDLAWRLVQPERRGSFVGSVAEQRLDGEHVAAAGLAGGDSLDFPQPLRGKHANGGIG